MSTSSTYFSLTGDQIIDVITNGYVWTPGADRTINWSLSNGWNKEFWTNPVDATTGLAAVFKTFSDVANIKFNYTGYFLDPLAAAYAGSDINISLDGYNKYFISDTTWARGFFPNPFDPNRGDIYLNMRSPANNLPSYAPGSAGYFLAIHEIGHTLGLKHSHDPAGTGRPTFQDIGYSSIDKDIITVMSYEDDAPLNLIAWDPATPMALDVIGLQYLYGKNNSTNATDTSYYLQNDGLYSTIWDAGGIDTVFISNAQSGWTINLPSLQLSSLVNTKIGSASISSEAGMNVIKTTFKWLMGDIENAVGTQFADSITGNAFNNTIDGNYGVDIVYFSGRKADYAINGANISNIIVSDNISSRDGRDTLISVERLNFSDSAVAFDLNGSAGQAYRIYEAAFNRKPDTGGLGYWIAQLDKGATLKSVADGFLGSSEFKALYGSSPTNSAFVDSLYKNILDRAGEKGGVDYWTGQLNSGMSRADVLVGFSESHENQVGVIGAIQNGIEYKEWLG